MLPRSVTKLKVAAGAAAGAFAYHAAFDLRSTSAYHWMTTTLGMPAIRMLDPETAHNLAVKLAAAGLAPIDPYLRKPDPILETSVWGLRFRSPVGLAAGFDKHAEAIDGFLSTGFGFVEIGSVTPLAQPGNPKPRMFRLTEDEAVINRYGFNSDGKDTVAGRLATFWRHHGWRVASPEPPATAGTEIAMERHKLRRIQSLAEPPTGLVGVNLGKNKEGEALSDYVSGLRKLAPYADYLVVNVSSPNTPGLRALQGRTQLHELLSSVKSARDTIPWGLRTSVGDSGAAAGSWHAGNQDEANLVFLRPTPPPLLVKIAPDVSDEDLADIAAVAIDAKIDGIICTNTTIARPDTLTSGHKLESGGLSGKPLLESSTEVLRKMFELTGGQIPLVGVGGVSTGEDAYKKIRNGASLVEIYSALAYEGPTLGSSIKTELAALLKRDGFDSVNSAVGVDTAIKRG